MSELLQQAGIEIFNDPRKTEGCKTSIVAGHCGFNHKRQDELGEIAGLPGILGVRVVDFKSRTSYNPTGKGMGSGFNEFNDNLQSFIETGSTKDFIMSPGVLFAADLAKKTGKRVAMEIMDPILQLAVYAMCRELDGKLIVWNPSVDQLGSHLFMMASWAKKNNWMVGIKNGKTVGGALNPDGTIESEKVDVIKQWAGLHSYAVGSKINPDQVVLIHRGFNTPENNDYRNLPSHEIAALTKILTGAEVWFDPSHICGPKNRDQIISETLSAMGLVTISKDGQITPLYDGILIEVGTSETDTDQHLTIAELKQLMTQLQEQGRVLVDC